MLEDLKITMSEYPDDYDWLQVKRRAIKTMGLNTVKTMPTTEWKHSILKAKHSPIRRLFFSFDIENLPYWVSTELSRHHEGCEKYIKSQRNDRQKEYDRNKAPQDAPVNMIFDFNAEGLMNVCEKRLCGVATPEARYVITKIKELVLASFPEFDGLLDPFCQKYHTCIEMNPCGRLSALKNQD